MRNIKEWFRGSGHQEQRSGILSQTEGETNYDARLKILSGLIEAYFGEDAQNRMGEHGGEIIKPEISDATKRLKEYVKQHGLNRVDIAKAFANIKWPKKESKDNEPESNGDEDKRFQIEKLNRVLSIALGTDYARGASETDKKKIDAFNQQMASVKESLKMWKVLKDEERLEEIMERMSKVNIPLIGMRARMSPRQLDDEKAMELEKACKDADVKFTQEEIDTLMLELQRLYQRGPREAVGV